MSKQVKPSRFDNGVSRELRRGEETIDPEFLGTGARDSSKILNGLGQWVNNPALPGASLPAGVYLPYGGSSAPEGFLLCDGSAVSRSVYADLFSAIGTSYGVGDGSTTFNVPDFGDGEFPMGGTPGETGGANTINLQHDHGGVTGTPSSLSPDILVGVSNVVSATHTHSISNDLSTTQDNRPKYVGGNFIIKT